MSTSESQTALPIDALVIRATFQSQFPGPGAELASFARVAEAFDLTLGTAWLLGAEELLRTKTIESNIANALSRWNQTGLLGMVARHRLRSHVGESMSQNDSAMPRVTFINPGPPLDISILLPAALQKGVGFLAVSVRMLEQAFTTSVHIKAKRERLEAEIAEWLAMRSRAELGVFDAAAHEIASPPLTSASRLEIDEPDSNGH